MSHLTSDKAIQPLILYNTASRSKEILKPLQDNHVRLYTCGPTVYNFAHIGNFRTYVFEDLLRRAIQFFGFKITQVMNLTDVDDKTIRGALAQGTSLDDYTQVFKDAFFADLKTLNIQPAEFYPAATDYIPEMIHMVQLLLDKKVAYYGGDGSVYFEIGQFPHYGCLSHLNLEELKVGASERVAVDEYEKEHAADFVLWKAYDAERDGQIYWDSPFGKGRPGWHLECSAMAMKILGETLDIHVGGIDNMFPHHENEIAQSEACSGKKFVQIWMHAEHLVVDGKKMSKSLGNFYTLRDLLNRGYTGRQIRMLLLQTHYKTQLNFTFQGLEAVKSSLQRLDDFVMRLETLESSHDGGQIEGIIHDTSRMFRDALGEDLNISSTLAALFEFVRHTNALCDANTISKKEAELGLSLLHSFDSVLGLLSFNQKSETIPDELKEAFQNRMQARKDKNWALADQMRDFIYQKGFVIEDSPQGSRLKKA